MPWADLGQPNGVPSMRRRTFLQRQMQTSGLQSSSGREAGRAAETHQMQARGLQSRRRASSRGREAEGIPRGLLPPPMRTKVMLAEAGLTAETSSRIDRVEVAGSLRQCGRNFAYEALRPVAT